MKFTASLLNKSFICIVIIIIFNLTGHKLVNGSVHLIFIRISDVPDIQFFHTLFAFIKNVSFSILQILTK